MTKVRWGVLGVAKIATERVIPAMQRGDRCDIAAIASRDAGRARQAAATLGIPRAYGSYDALLADPDVEAVYIALPNHLHVPWTIRAAERGKHVLCEKPIALTGDEAATLLAVRARTGVRIQEAFMIRAHPQWRAAIETVRAGRLGPVRSVLAHFSYRNLDGANIRNVAAFGGGGLMDIGCYLVHTARWIFDREPSRVECLIDRDSASGIDRLTSMLLDFDGAHAAATCATQMTPYQRVQIFGTLGRLEIEIPFNAPPDRPCRIVEDIEGAGTRAIEFPVCDQFMLQGDAFACALREHTPQPLPLEDAIANMRVIDALVGASVKAPAVSVHPRP